MSTSTKTLLGLLLIIGIAALLRLPLLATIPEGLWYDEAWVSIRARDTVALQTYAIYFEANFGGMHPAIVYLTVLARWLSGGSPLAVRYGVAIIGLLTLPLAGWAYYQLAQIVPSRAIDPTKYALLSSFILAITFPFVIFNRIGFESVLPAIPAVILFGSLARGVRTGHYGWYGLAGVSIGLGMYTFDAARFLPIAFTVALIGLGMTGWPKRQLLLGWGITAVLALILFAPLGIYFGQNWDQFLLRATTTTTQTLGPDVDNVPLTLLQNVGKTVAGISLPGFGDQMARHNIPGRPIYDLFLSILFWLGLVGLLRRPRHPLTILLLSWLGVLLIPTILTEGAPTYTRILGAMPALAGIAGWGGLWLAANWPPGWGRVVSARVVLAASLLFSLLTTTIGVFHFWPQYHRVEVFGQDDWLAGQAALDVLADGPLYVVPDMINEARPTLDLLLRTTPAQPVTPHQCLPYWPGHQQTYLIDTRQNEGMLARLVDRFPQGEIRPLLSEMVLFSVDIPPAPATTPAAHFGGLALLAYELGDPADGGLPIRLFWSVTDADVVADYTIFLHLYPTAAPEVAPIAQRDSMPCAGGYWTGRWRTGEVIVDDHWLPLPVDGGNKTAVLGLGLYHWADQVRVPLRSDAATLPGDRLILAEIELE